MYHFPLRERLEALLGTSKYRELLRYAQKRKSNDDYFSDVQDTPSTLIRFLLCICCMRGMMGNVRYGQCGMCNDSVDLIGV